MKILIIRLSSLGDIVLTEPVSAALRLEHPDAQIDYFTKAAYVQVVEAFDSIDNIFIYKTTRILRKLKGNYDIVIDLHAKLNTFLIKLAVGGKKTATYNKKPILRRRLIRGNKEINIGTTVGLYFSALKKLGINRNYENPRLTAVSSTSAITKDRNRSTKKIGIFPGALHQTKRYPLQLHAEVINSLPNEFDILLFGSKNERADVEELISKLNRKVINVCGNLNITELVATMNDLDLIISNDSGPMHIAAALGKKQIALFGATHPVLGFSPMNNNATVICMNLDCQPCSLHGAEKCPKEHFNCMNEIKPSEIVEKLIKILD
jgi:heptosyltransferase II